jgi:hypothetical protein
MVLKDAKKLAEQKGYHLRRSQGGYYLWHCKGRAFVNPGSGPPNFPQQLDAVTDFLNVQFDTLHGENHRIG